MRNTGYRLVASAVVFLAGTVAFSSPRLDHTDNVGMVIMALGGFNFVYEWVKSFREDRAGRS